MASMRSFQRVVSALRRPMPAAAWRCSRAWTARVRTGYWRAPVRRVSASSTPVAARNTAISAVSAGFTVISGRAHAGAVALVQPACAFADVLGQALDQLFAAGQIGAPLRIVGQCLRHGGQPAQDPDAGRVGSGGVDAVIEHCGGVGGVVDAALGQRVGQQLAGVGATEGQDGEVAAQHRPGLARCSVGGITASAIASRRSRAPAPSRFSAAAPSAS